MTLTVCYVNKAKQHKDTNKIVKFLKQPKSNNRKPEDVFIAYPYISILLSNEKNQSTDNVFVTGISFLLGPTFFSPK